MTSARVWRESIRGGRSPTPATSIIWPDSASCRRAQPWRTLSSSASAVGVRSAMAMSLVIWSPAIGTTAVWRIAPSRNTAMSLVPPPMSTRHTPSSFSSSVSTASEEASGCRIRSFTSRPQRRTHFTMFCAADTAPVTMCTFTSSRTPLMPSGSRTPSWPSMMNSWVRMWSTCWSVGIGMARAVSIERSTSVCVTSLSLIATMPVELKLLMWLPAIPVKTRSILQSAMSSASSSVRWIAFTVASMFTTTPFFRPLDSWPPMPTMSMCQSGDSSATTATTLEVPMSSATMRFLFSLAMSDSPVTVGVGTRRFHGALSRVYRESVGVTQVDVVDALARLAERLRERRHEAREAVLDAIPLGIATELEREPVREPDLPGEARRQQHLRRLEAERRERVPERDVAPRDLALAARRPREDRECRVALAAEKLAVGIDQLDLLPLLPPARGGPAGQCPRRAFPRPERRGTPGPRGACGQRGRGHAALHRVPGRARAARLRAGASAAVVAPRLADQALERAHAPARSRFRAGSRRGPPRALRVGVPADARQVAPARRLRRPALLQRIRGTRD